MLRYPEAVDSYGQAFTVRDWSVPAMTDAFIFGATRTPFARYEGSQSLPWLDHVAQESTPDRPAPVGDNVNAVSTRATHTDGATTLILFVAATGGASQLGCREAEWTGCRQW